MKSFSNQKMQGALRGAHSPNYDRPEVELMAAAKQCSTLNETADSREIPAVVNELGGVIMYAEKSLEALTIRLSQVIATEKECEQSEAGPLVTTTGLGSDLATLVYRVRVLSNRLAELNRTVQI